MKCVYWSNFQRQTYLKNPQTTDVEICASFEKDPHAGYCESCRDSLKDFISNIKILEDNRLAHSKDALVLKAESLHIQLERVLQELQTVYPPTGPDADIHDYFWVIDDDGKCRIVCSDR